MAGRAALDELERVRPSLTGGPVVRSGHPPDEFSRCAAEPWALCRRRYSWPCERWPTRSRPLMGRNCSLWHRRCTGSAPRTGS
jgi:hypothetical protein